jgi:hypothetical protein
MMAFHQDRRLGVHATKFHFPLPMVAVRQDRV